MKIVYYGPGMCGKTTNLVMIHKAVGHNARGNLISLNTSGDRTIFFDLLPMDLGNIRGNNIRISVYTVPGQVKYNATRKLVLKGADGVVFVADSQRMLRAYNIESLRNLNENLLEFGYDPARLPLVIQYNKRDLAGNGIDTMPIGQMEKDLNRGAKRPQVAASALLGHGVKETFRRICIDTSKDVYGKMFG